MRGRWIVVAAVLLAVWPARQAQAAGRCGDHPWCDTSLSPAKRADLLLDALTPAERIGLLAGDDPAGVTGAAGTHTGAALGVPRLDLPPLYLTDGPVGVRQGQSTALPSSLGAGRQLQPAAGPPRRRAGRQRGQAQGQRRRLRARRSTLLRTPLWGRAFESLGEDPFLTARMGVEWIRGAQARA